MHSLFLSGYSLSKSPILDCKCISIVVRIFYSIRGYDLFLQNGIGFELGLIPFHLVLNAFNRLEILHGFNSKLCGDVSHFHHEWDGEQDTRSRILVTDDKSPGVKLERRQRPL
jgi:hypothetical protein